MTTAISAQHVTFRYPKGNVALSDVSLEIGVGSVVSLIGRNGSGKTTLAKHFNALLKPSLGEVTVMGQNTKEKTASEMARFVGFAFQNPEDQLFESSVYDEVAFGPRNLERNKENVNQRVHSALETVGLSSILKEHPYNLTYGQRKMLCIASVLAMDPAVVVLDEPNAGQDYFGMLSLGSIIHQLKAKGKTCVLISHDIEFVAKHCDQTILMEDGKVLVHDLTRNVLSEGVKLASSAVVAPQVTRLAARLSHFGIKRDIITVEEMVQTLIQYFQGN